MTSIKIGIARLAYRMLTPRYVSMLRMVKEVMGKRSI